MDISEGVTGTDGLTRVFVNWIELDEDYWSATWQTADDHRIFDGTRAETLAWARSQPADEYLIFDAERGYVPLTDDA